MTRLDDVPTAFEAPIGAQPSSIVARLRAIRPSRRTVLRGLLIGAAAAALVPIDWFLTRRGAQAAPADESKSEFMTCEPENYDEKANNWPAGGPAVCYGGWRRGGFPCEDGFHREGVYEGFNEYYDSVRLATNCEGRNAWRWNGWRCSDALTNITFPDGETYHGITIAACQITADDRGAATERAPATPAAPNPAPAPAPASAPAPAPSPPSTPPSTPHRERWGRSGDPTSNAAAPQEHGLLGLAPQ